MLKVNREILMTGINFLMKVWRPQGREWFYCISTKSNKWKDHFFKLNEKKKLTKFLDSIDTKKVDVYFCPTPFKRKRRLSQHVAGSSFLWSDLDEVNPESIEPKPTVAWESSPGRYAALWMIEKLTPAKEIEAINKQLTYFLGADKGGWDLSQVLRLPGTRNNKYKKKPTVKLLWQNTESYNLKDLSKYKQIIDPLEILKKYRYKLSKSLVNQLTKRKATVGKRSEILWKLEAELYEAGLSPNEIYWLVKNSAWNKFVGRTDEEKRLRTEIEKVTGLKEANNTPILAGLKVDKPKPTGTTPEFLIKRVFDVEPKDVDWIWYPYIPRGKVIIIEGDPGLGKSWITLSIAAKISRQSALPEQKEKPIKGKVLLMSVEDDVEDTIRPRLDLLKANNRLIYYWTKPIIFDEDGTEILEEQVRELQPKIIVIDPLVAFLGGSVDLHRANETREVMARLGYIADRYKTTIICIRHLTKSTKEKSIYRGIGSIDLTAASRSVLLVGHDPEDEDLRAIAHIKSNLSPLGPTIRYRLDHRRKVPFKWEGKCNLTAEDIIKATRPKISKQQEIDNAIQFLQNTLQKKRLIVDVIAEAEGQGITRNILMQATRDMNILRSKKSWRISPR